MITLDQVARGPRPKQEGETLDRPLEHLVACHRRIEDRLAILARAGNHMQDRRTEALQAIENSLSFFAVNVARHNADEEESFFPRLRGQLPDADLSLLNRLESDHVTAEGLLSAIRDTFETVRALPAEADVTSYKQKFLATVAELTELFRDHIAAEDDQLIAMASKALPETALRDIASEMKARRGR